MARSACAAFGGCCSACTSWFPCVLLCVVLGLLSLPCGAALCRVALLLAFLPISGSFFFCWHAHRCWCAGPGGAACRSLHPLVAVGLSHLQLGGTRGTGQCVWLAPCWRWGVGSWALGDAPRACLVCGRRWLCVGEVPVWWVCATLCPPPPPHPSSTPFVRTCGRTESGTPPSDIDVHHTYTQHRRDASLMHSREPSPSRPHREEKATQT